MKRKEFRFPHEAELEKIIEKHLPDTSYEVSNKLEAVCIRLAYIFASTRQKVWKSEDEIAKLKKIEKGIEAAISESEKLEGLVMAALVGDSSPIADKPEGVISTLRQVEHAMKRGIKAASEVARLGRARRGQGGHPNYDAISVLKACREIWKRRGVKGSTETTNYKPGPFGRFVEAVFRELFIIGKKGEIMTAASAMRAEKNLAKHRQRRQTMLTKRRRR